MAKPFGDQKNFDKNGDGRLGANEWFNWYTWKYGVDIENQERRAVSSEIGRWESWLNWADGCVENNHDRFFDNAKKLITPWDTETQLLAEHTYIGWITTGLAAGDALKTVLKTTSAGIYYPNTSFRPYHRLLKELARRNADICSYKELEAAALAKRVLYREECYLGDTGYGAFWDRLFHVLPPFEKGVLHSADRDVYSIVPELEPIRNLVEGLITSAALFSGKSGDDNHNYIDHYQELFIKHWKARCGTKEEMIIRSIREFWDKLNSFIASLGEPDDRYGYSAIAAMTAEELCDLRESTDEMLEALTIFDPDDMDAEQWQQRLDMEGRLLSIRCYADEKGIDLEKAAADTGRTRFPAEGDEVVDGGTVFTFYTVYVDLAGRTYTYLAPGAYYNVGDQVIVPFGRKNTEARGTVREIKQCTASNAPYPPGKIKCIIRPADGES